MNALYSLYDALVSINVPSERARAVVDAMERDMGTVLATKADLAASQQLTNRDMDAGFKSLKQDMDLLLYSITVRFGFMLAVGLGVLFAALKLT